MTDTRSREVYQIMQDSAVVALLRTRVLIDCSNFLDLQVSSRLSVPSVRLSGIPLRRTHKSTTQQHTTSRRLAT